MPKDEKPTQQDTGNTGGGDSDQGIDLSQFFTRSVPSTEEPEVRVVKKD